MSFQGECFLRIFLFICNIPLMDSVFSVMLLCILDVPIKLPVRACDYALFFFFFFSFFHVTTLAILFLFSSQHNQSI